LKKKRRKTLYIFAKLVNNVIRPSLILSSVVHEQFYKKRLSLTNISWFVGLYISLYLLRVGLPNWIRCVCRYLQFLRSFITCQTSILSNLFAALDSKGIISESGIAGIGISCHPPIGTDALRDRRSQGRIIQCTIIQGRRQSQVSLIGVATRRTEIAEIVEISGVHALQLR